MKNNILLGALLIASFCSGQNIFQTNGYVGIGTSAPTSDLEILESSESRPGGVSAPTKSIFKLTRAGTFGSSYNENAEFRIGHGGSSVYGSKLDLYVNGGANINSIPDQQVMTWNYDGNVGIGTTTPSAKLNVVGNIKIDNLDWTTDNSLLIREGGSDDYGAFFRYGVNDLLTIGTKSSGLDYIAMQVSRGSLNAVFNGNVGIGTTAPDAKLAVNGTIHSKEVKVDLNIPAPDYVFANDYKLKTLQEVEDYVKENSHLPEIPSAKEMEKNGVMLAEMNMSLLKKIEELTLYMIEMKKENESIKNENDLIKKNQIELKKQIENISKK